MNTQGATARHSPDDDLESDQDAPSNKLHTEPDAERRREAALQLLETAQSDEQIRPSHTTTVIQCLTPVEAATATGWQGSRRKVGSSTL